MVVFIFKVGKDILWDQVFKIYQPHFFFFWKYYISLLISTLRTLLGTILFLIPYHIGSMGIRWENLFAIHFMSFFSFWRKAFVERKLLLLFFWTSLIGSAINTIALKGTNLVIFNWVKNLLTTYLHISTNVEGLTKLFRILQVEVCNIFSEVLWWNSCLSY